MKKDPFEGKTKICLLAGGTGITPCLSIAQASLLAEEGAQIKLVFCNKTQADILCSKELKELAQKYPANFKFFNTLTREENPAKGLYKGRISSKLLKDCEFPEPSPEVFFHTCGPGEFGNTCKAVLLEMGYVEGVNFV